MESTPVTIDSPAPQQAPRPRLPAWIRQRARGGERYAYLKSVLREFHLHTVCEEAKCPNMGECWEHGAATFMLMGDVCTRRCNFCAVAKGKPGYLDAAEPDHVATVVAAMNLDYCVLTSVTRDDLPDQGADHVARTIEAIHARLPDCKLEMLIPDFRGDPDCIARVVRTPLAVLAHNMETVPRLYKQVRPGAVYERSLRVLQMAKEFRSDILTKSGLMLGLGETRDELIAVFRDLRQHGCDILTLGQYLRPTEDQLTVTRYVTPQEFATFKDDGLKLGFRHVESGPLVRSSYHAWQHVQ
ncbi:MAG TPA: lipoyl synthase [Verrucomicrobiae bacterium]|nr:lipoyl synthase [Verrucomicrobiae bacterium]